MAFRISEIVQRVITACMLCLCVRIHLDCWWGGYAILLGDYLVGVSVLLCIGWRDRRRLHSVAGLLLGLPLVVANVVQFVDVPVLAYQARRISRVLHPLRFIELTLVLAACSIP